MAERIIEDVHKKTLHDGVGLTIANIQENY